MDGLKVSMYVHTYSYLLYTAVRHACTVSRRKRAPCPYTYIMYPPVRMQMVICTYPKPTYIHLKLLIQLKFKVQLDCVSPDEGALGQHLT